MEFTDWRADVLPKEYVPRNEFNDHEEDQDRRIKDLEDSQTWLIRFFIGGTLSTVFGLVLAVARIKNGA